ncbi:MAG: peptidoglycan DD-metalloendopeptidase family protein [Rhodospirillales bacterium]|nr:peptidoglycan DD-metalloendopeptidase family protein [Rhodospirillales bacterium]
MPNKVSKKFPKKLRGFLPVVALGTIVTLSAISLLSTVSIQETSEGTTFSLAPISLGNPAVASTLQTRQTETGTPSSTDETSWTAKVTVSAAPVIPLTSVDTLPTVMPMPVSKMVKLKSGGTLSGVLTGAGISNKEAAAIVTAFSEAFNPRKIRAGQEFELQYMPKAGDVPEQFVALEFERTKTNLIRLERSGDSFKAWEEEKVLTTKILRSEGRINSSLYVAGVRANLPLSILAELIRAYSWDVDFQRSIRKNDGFSVLYEARQDIDGNTLDYGKILFAELELSGDKLPIYLHILSDGTEDYFDNTGKSAKKTLMRTPIDGARLSSGYGNRKHPTLGYTKLHTGVDFAAPRGTPIYAAGDGAIDFIGRKGGYGKYIRIRHNGEYSTAYAHMKSYKKGMKTGKRVKQGQIIGYVGTTGRSTGPHLHYEILKNGAKVNPMKVKMPSGRKLKGEELELFMATVHTTNDTLAAAESVSPTTVAQTN